MHNHHNFYYNQEERNKRQDPSAILQDIGLKSAMVFMDIGSNDGFFTLPAAKIVGLKGKIYAVDISKSAIEKLNNKFKESGMTNYVARVAKAEETVFGENIADFIFLGTVLHDFEDPAKVLKNAKTMLKKEGKLVNLDWRKKAMDIGPPLDIRFSKTKAAKLIEDAGLTITKCHDYDNNYYVIEAVMP
jgi:ubiquinone/menaquinone biosynthesis C-methylase UbiE